MANDATLTLEGLNQKLLDARGRELVQKDAQGEERPLEEQVTLGNVLLACLCSMDPKTPPQKQVVALKARKRLLEAMEADGPVTFGTALLGVTRDALRTNGPGYVALITQQAWEAIGTGQPDADE